MTTLRNTNDDRFPASRCGMKIVGREPNRSDERDRGGAPAGTCVIYRPARRVITLCFSSDAAVVFET